MEARTRLLAHLCFLNIVSVGLLTFLLLNKSSRSRCLGPIDVRRLYCCMMSRRARARTRRTAGLPADVRMIGDSHGHAR